MRYCARCHFEEAWHVVADEPLCPNCYDEQYESDLMKHSAVCKCRACREYEVEYAQYCRLRDAGLLDAGVCPNTFNKYAEVQF